ncbi:MAG TPA: thiamine pyrophosphate-dependent enzyme [Acidobacteriota bacterium]|nr:thiamine pyrophosphate-dependent enzyme [Acidobacteriota bacterium]
MTTAPTKTAYKAKDFQQPSANDWCPGCGDFGILNAMHQACAKLSLDPSNVVAVGGIGCSGKAPYYMGTYSVHTLHGRPIPYATGIKLANPELTVLIAGGDGDGLGIGAGHFVNVGRRNVDLTYVMFNNEVYGLTKGQAAPTMAMGMQTKSLPEPHIQMKLNPLMMAYASGFTWIGRGYSYNVKQLVELLVQAISHPGLSFLDVLQPCPTYNNLHTKDWFAGKDLEEARPRVQPLPDDYDPVIEPEMSEDESWEHTRDFMEMSQRWGDHIPTGLFFENRAVSSFADRIGGRIPSYSVAAPAVKTIADENGRSNAMLEPIFDELSIS